MKRLFFLVAVLSLALAATAVAATKLSSGNYKGKTTQHKSITVTVSTKKSACAKQKRKAPCVLSTTYKADYRCYDENDDPAGQASDQKTRLGAVEIRKNKVSATFGDSSDTIKLKLTFRGRKASGSFHEVYTAPSGHRCYSEPPTPGGVVKFSLKR